MIKPESRAVEPEVLKRLWETVYEIPWITQTAVYEEKWGPFIDKS